MTRIVRSNSIKTQDASQDSSYISSQDSPNRKSPTESAMLAQRLASDTSWADRYIPSTPTETTMTPGSSVADHSEHMRGSEYMTPNEAPPSYEDVTNMTASEASSVRSSQQPPAFAAPSQRPFLPGRRYSRHETSQSIQGTFTLYDSLDLSTTSGTISIKLDVKPGPGPARLSLKTESGSVSVNDKQCDAAMTHRTPSHASSSRAGGGGLLSFFMGPRCPPASSPPVPFSDDPRKQPGQHLAQQDETAEDTPVARVIHTTIETSSGSVNGHLLLTATSSTYIKTKSGSINLRLVTADSSASTSRSLSKLEAEDTRLSSGDFSSALSTTSSHGSQSIQITTGRTDTSSGAIVSACKASHHSTGSSSVRASYPKDWEGLVHGSVGGSSSVDITGQGLEFDRRGNRDIWAWRGADLPDVDKAVQVRCDGSGSVRFEC